MHRLQPGGTPGHLPWKPARAGHQNGDIHAHAALIETVLLITQQRLDFPQALIRYRFIHHARHAGSRRAGARGIAEGKGGSEADIFNQLQRGAVIRITVTKPNSLGGELLADTKPQTSERDAA